MQKSRISSILKLPLSHKSIIKKMSFKDGWIKTTERGVIIYRAGKPHILTNKESVRLFVKTQNLPPQIKADLMSIALRALVLKQIQYYYFALNCFKTNALFLPSNKSQVKKIMPLYEYNCINCRRKFDRIIRNAPDRDQVKCPECGKPVKRQISRTSPPVFSGSGFYKTDYQNKP